MKMHDLGVLTRARRIELGLRQVQLASLSGLSRTTINLLENGTLNDIGVAKATQLMDVLGIELQANKSLHKKNNALLMASRTASVSYRDALSVKELSSALASGFIPKDRMAHIATLLDEVQLGVIVSAVEEASISTKVAPKKIWAHINQWATDFKSPRISWN